MELLWVKYTNKNNSTRYILLLPLGKRGNKLCCLEASEIPDALAKMFVNYMRDKPFRSRMKWLKANYPTLLRHIYKELDINRMLVCNSYKIGGK